MSGRHLGRWRKRWTIIKGNTIRTYKTNKITKKTRPTETLNFNDFDCCLPMSDPMNAFELVSEYLTIMFIANCEEKQKEWIKLINKKIKQCKNGNDIFSTPFTRKYSKSIDQNCDYIKPKNYTISNLQKSNSNSNLSQSLIHILRMTR